MRASECASRQDTDTRVLQESVAQVNARVDIPVEQLGLGRSELREQIEGAFGELEGHACGPKTFGEVSTQDSEDTTRMCEVGFDCAPPLKGPYRSVLDRRTRRRVGFARDVCHRVQKPTQPRRKDECTQPVVLQLWPTAAGKLKRS